MLKLILSTNKTSEDGKAELQRDITRLQFEKASTSKPKMDFCGPEFVEEEEEEEEGDLETSQTNRNLVVLLQKKLATKEEMLNEAVIEFHSKNEQVERLQQENELFQSQLAQFNVQIADFQV